MSGMLKKVQSGSPFRPQAGDWNAFVDAAKDFQTRQRSRSRPDSHADSLQNGMVAIRNSTGADQDRFAILGIDAPIITPAANLDQFKNRMAFDGVIPSSDTHAGRYVVLREPLKAGAIGRGWAAGVCPVRVNVTDEAHGFAVLVNGNTGNLESTVCGGARILWKESGTGIKWAVVRLGGTPRREITNPKVLTGSGSTANTETWDIDAQPLGTDGVQVEKWFRLYWSGTSGDPVYQFSREAKYNACGKLCYVGPEVRSVAFGTDSCQ